MAIITLGELVAGIRGTTGGLTYSANRSGPYVKPWAKGPNPRSPLQQNLRGEMSQQGLLWQALTGAQRTAWQAFALADPEPTYNSLGELIVPTGYMYFCRMNIRRAQYTLPPLTDAPGAPENARPASMAPLTLDVLTPGSGPSTITWDTTNAVANGLAVIYFAFSISGARAPKTSGFKLMGLAPAGDGTADSETILGEKFGSVQPGWLCTCNFYQRRSGGLQSTIEVITAIVA